MYHQLYKSQLDRFKESFLSAAARGGRIDEVASLIDLAGEGEDALDLSTPFLEAIAGQHVEVVSLLLANGADPKRRTGEGNNALHLAAHVSSNCEMQYQTNTSLIVTQID